MVGLTAPLPIPEQPLFAAIVRTTGARNALLLEALQSLALQSLPCVPIVIVHGSAESYASVQQASGAAHVVHAPHTDPARRRGYPINAGIDYCLHRLPAIQYLFLLDDDDTVYPFFTRMMHDAFQANGADVVYAMANRLEGGKPLSLFSPPRPYFQLFDQNFLPSNSYAIRVEALRRSAVRVDETMDSLEDWLFLLNLLEHGLRFQQLDMALSEFRSENGADFAYRNDLEQWKSNNRRICQYVNSTKFPIPGPDLASLREVRHIPAGTDAALHRRIWDLEHSFSWKCTAPVRAVAGSLLRLRSRWKARV
jgi:glycosyltransferase involved in cell wall biosynthesis